SANPTSGNLLPSGQTYVLVSFNTTGLNFGTYTCTLRITSNDPVNPIIDIPVTMTILPPQILVNPLNFTLTLVQNQLKDTILVISNTGVNNLNWYITEIPVIDWLSLNLTNGVIPPSNQTNIVVSFNTIGLNFGIYACTLRITSNDPVNPIIDVSVQLIISGWAQKSESIPSNVPDKYVKDGGALVSVNSHLYAFRGNKSNEFYMFNGASWTLPLAIESMPFGYKPDNPTRINKKKIGKGASLCYDGESLIYAIKGNGTKEFWAYSIADDTWITQPFVPIAKGLKGGSALAYKDEKIYLLAGSQKDTDKNFFVYDIGTNTWDTLTSAPLSPDDKPFKDGSCITIIRDTIYCLKGSANHNYFWLYDIADDIWVEKETIPLKHSMLGRQKNKVKDGGAITTDGNVIYAIKGGGKQDFWQYTIEGGWLSLETIPRLHRNSVPKTGAALAYANSKVWLLKGNNTPEFWYYGQFGKSNVKTQMSNLNAQKINTSYPFMLYQNSPNPFKSLTAIRYSLPAQSKVSLVIYDVSGRLIKTLVNEHKAPGIYSIIWNGTD
ncbi:MAG: hypothetical protein N2748_04035, partial [candidate division WOR-3 bacterium]|nr:hypothetical protein [candidate division WOR-3 bacterium]